MFDDVIEITKGLGVIFTALFLVGGALAAVCIPLALAFNAVFGSGCLL